MKINLSMMTKDQLRQHILMLAMQLTQLEEENKKLKEELSKYKKQYEHSMGEDDELIYEEGLYD